MSNFDNIRNEFLSYFEKNNHEIVKSSSLVPENDDSIMFTNAGMVQFKNVFTGNETRAIPRAVTAQKCVRAGGKHNDLENVGHTARHHTFFEMLGNFSFGDYFKEEAIFYAWDLITNVYGLPKDRLLVTVYHDDDASATYWKKISGLSDDKIIRIATKDNFWSLSDDSGPCGPCTELFYDHGEDVKGGPPGSINADGDRFVEIWNLVFMQYEQQSDGTRIDLPKPSVDTGMGIERIAAVIQGKHDNYDTDLFQELISIAKYNYPKANNISHRIIADHIRAICFLIADGVTPSNNGRGYVLRRIMRRAMRHGHSTDDIMKNKQILHQLVPTLIDLMGGHYKERNKYDELHHNRELIMSTIIKEEEKFKRTLDKGLKLLTSIVEKSSNNTKILEGKTAFKLYDTYGFPLDLTQDVMRDYGWNVDVVGFDNFMQQQKMNSKGIKS